MFIGFPLGGFLSLALMASTAIVFAPADISVDTLSQAALPTALALGKVGLALVIVGFFAATFGAALETSLSAGYTVAQFFGWQWGKLVAPREASRFHLVTLGSIVLATLVVLTARRSGQGDRVLDRAVGGGPAPHLHPDPPRRQ